MTVAPASIVVPALATTAALAVGLGAWLHHAFGGRLPKTMHPAWQWHNLPAWFKNYRDLENLKAKDLPPPPKDLPGPLQKPLLL